MTRNGPKMTKFKNCIFWIKTEYKINVKLHLVAALAAEYIVNICSVISLITNTHFQHVKAFGRAVQTQIPAKLMRETVTVTIIVQEVWDAALATVGLCIQAILIAAKKKVDNLWSGMTESLFIFPDSLFPSALFMLCSPFFQFSKLKVLNLHFLQKQKNLQF